MGKKLSRQRLRQLTLIAAGLCQSCGVPRTDEYYCDVCRRKHNESSDRWYYLKKHPEVKRKIIETNKKAKDISKEVKLIRKDIKGLFKEINKLEK